MKTLADLAGGLIRILDTADAILDPPFQQQLLASVAN